MSLFFELVVVQMSLFFELVVVQMSPYLSVLWWQFLHFLVCSGGNVSIVECVVEKTSIFLSYSRYGVNVSIF